jgi:hypothetical protein
VCDGKDNDCDGITDEEGAQGCVRYFYDFDGDNFGISFSKCLCAPDPQTKFTALNTGDCNDNDASINPSAIEKCNSKDDNCDGRVDEEGAQGCTIYYYDGDYDTYGVTGDTKCLCSPSGKYSATRAGDCDDSDPQVYPGATERCDGKDNNCDGSIDPSGSQGCITYYYDADNDTYGTSQSQCLCSPSGNFRATRSGDCDDAQATINPGQPEVCNNSKDDNCNGQTDEAGSQGCITYYYDADNDTYGTSQSQCLCSADGNFRATRSGDCNDNDAQINPGATEKCDGIDNNCNGQTDEEGAQGCTPYFYDNDQDGFGIPYARCLCAPDTQGRFTATAVGDCDDNDPTVNPHAVEKCNGKDDDCDQQTDEERTSGQCGIDGYALYYYDGDYDTYGDTQDTKCLCSPSGKYNVTRGGDCNDVDPRAHPGAPAVCGIDADCDGSLLDPGEVCDDGNSVRWDGCTDCLYLEFQVNTWTPDYQQYPSITSLSNGGFVVVWESGCDPYLNISCTGTPQDGSKFGVYGQRFDSNGNELGSEFQVNTWTTDYQGAPSITALSNGGFVVVWQSNGQDGSAYGVYGQRFDSNGNKVGSEFQVNTWTTDNQKNPSVASLANGGFVVVWESPTDVVAQSFDSNGDKVGSEFRVNTWTTDYQEYPSITSLPNGGFVVVWQSYKQDGSDWGVYGQRFDSNGNKVGSEFWVNTWTLYDQLSPSITSLSNGGFVVVWAGNGADYGVSAQRFNSNGGRIGSEFLVNTWTTNYQEYPSITSLPNGGFVVVWQSYGQDGYYSGVYGQRFDSNGNKVGSEFQVNTWATYDQSYPSITSLSNGGFVVVWQSNGQDGSGYGVYGRIFSQ